MERWPFSLVCICYGIEFWPCSVLEQSELEESTQSTKYLQPFIHSILNLIEQLTSNTLVTTMLQTISLAIESVRDEIKPFVNDIMTAVSNMWQKSQHRPNVLSGIISIINNLVCSLVKLPSHILRLLASGALQGWRNNFSRLWCLVAPFRMAITFLW